MPEFHGYQDLIRDRVQDVLLVSSLYDHFILSQDGRLNEQFLGEFLELNLRHTPNLTHVSSGREAISMARERARFNLIITSIELGDMNVCELTAELRDRDIMTPVVLLAYDQGELNEFVAKHDCSEVERSFLWQGDVRILLAIVKYIEDKMNVAHDTGIVGVQAVILIEDNIRYYSSFLPVIYTELVKHSQSLMPEGINLTHKLMRIRARPKILLCDHYEEAWDYFNDYARDLLGIISDVQFPRGGKREPRAGIDFARQAHRIRPDVPIMLQSSRPENEELARSVGASFLLKGSPLLLNKVRKFMVESFRIGDFVFRLPDGREVGRASDLKSMEEMLHQVPAASLAYHGQRNDFSTWLKARTEFDLADKLRPRKVSDYSSLEELRESVIQSIAEYRRERNQGLIADFDRTSFDASGSFYRVGGGSLGGKARGLAFVNLLLSQHHIERRFPGVTIAVPSSLVLGTDLFDRFLEDNALDAFAIDCQDDAELDRRFQEAILPEDLRQDLAAFLDKSRFPLAVRSSSLLEDSQHQPFAGVYRTRMLSNHHSDSEVRLSQLLAAVKSVYASTYASRAKTFIKATDYRLEEEKMAVIIQQLVGALHEDRFYPDFSGVARSFDYYPVPPASGEDGIAAVALGLGKMVVEGGCCVRFSPSYPRHALQLSSVEETLRNCQREFYAISLAEEKAAAGREETWVDADLTSFGLEVAERDGTLAAVGSTYSPENQAVYDGISRPGVRLVSLAGVLKHGAFPLADILRSLFEIAEEGTGAPVEMEFAVNLATSEFGFLQLRPVVRSREIEDVSLGEVDKSSLICHSSSVLGNGQLSSIEDIVVVDVEKFERSESLRTAELVGQLNGRLLAESRPYLLVGVGRWGSSEPYLGIPVTWAQIAGAKAIVEAGFRDFHVTPSQGTHFFQNLTSNHVGYFTVNPQVGEGFLDWEWLLAQPPLDGDTRGESVRHLRFDRPIIIKMDGRRHEGMIFKPGAHDRGE